MVLVRVEVHCMYASRACIVQVVQDVVTCRRDTKDNVIVSDL